MPIMRNSLLGALLLFCAVVCQGQVDEQQAKATAEKATRVSIKYPKSELLRAHRREDLEDDLFRFQVKPQGKIAKAAYFYEVSSEGYFVLSPSEAVYVNSEDGHMVRLVAVSTISGEAYLLSGFSNATSELNRLVKDASLRISSTKDAEMYARFWFTVLTDPSSSRLIYGSRQLKHKIEDYFFSNYPEEKAQRSWEEWWQGFSSIKLNVPFDALASKNTLGYETTLAAINSSPKRIPLLDEWTLQISADGLCQTKSVRTIYPSNAKPSTARQAPRVN
jgi:hypothetical protein